MFFIFSAIILGLTMYPLSICCLIIGYQDPGNCDYLDKLTGLNGGQYLIGLGISGIISTTITILSIILMFINESCSVFSSFVILLISIISALFSIAWIIVGGMIIFGDNIECIREGSGTLIFSLIMWIFSTIHVLFSCCMSKKSRDETNN